MASQAPKGLDNIGTILKAIPELAKAIKELRLPLAEWKEKKQWRILMRHLRRMLRMMRKEERKKLRAARKRLKRLRKHQLKKLSNEKNL